MQKYDTCVNCFVLKCLFCLFGYCTNKPDNITPNNFECSKLIEAIKEN